MLPLTVTLTSMENAPLMSRLLKLTVGRVVVRFGVGVETGLGLEEPPQPTKPRPMTKVSPKAARSHSGLHGLLRVQKPPSCSGVGKRDLGRTTPAPEVLLE